MEIIFENGAVRQKSSMRLTFPATVDGIKISCSIGDIAFKKLTTLDSKVPNYLKLPCQDEIHSIAEKLIEEKFRGKYIEIIIEESDVNK